MTTCSVQTITHHHPHPSLTFMGSGTGSHSGSGSSSSSNSPPPVKTQHTGSDTGSNSPPPVKTLHSSGSDNNGSSSPPLVRTQPTGSDNGSGSPPHIKTEPRDPDEEEEEGGFRLSPLSGASRHSPPVGLLNNRNLVQDEKLVVATLASLESGDPSNIIKQDLRLIIQSRRKAEGKGELTVDFKTPPKDELTEEEWERARKRRDQNRLAAQRFRQKQRKISLTLSDRVRRLESANSQLKADVQTLEMEKWNLLKLVFEHDRDCSNADFRRKLQHALDSGLITRGLRQWPV